MTKDRALPHPPRPGDARTWEDYVERLRTLRVWAGSRDDHDLARAEPELTAEAIEDVLGQWRAVIPDRRAVNLIVRACLLLREYPEEHIAREQALWRAAWDQVLGGGRNVKVAPGRTRLIAASVVLPAGTGIATNLATSNRANLWAWGMVVLVVLAHAILLLAGPSRLARGPLAAGVAALVTMAVVAGLLLLPSALERQADQPAEPGCAAVDPARLVRPPVWDPEYRLVWRVAYACENDTATVYTRKGKKVGVLREGPPVNVFFCSVETAENHWYRTVADRGWGYVSEHHVHGPHPIPGLKPCP